MGNANKLFGKFFILCILTGVVLSGCRNAENAPATQVPQPTRDLVLEQKIEKQLNEMNSEAVPIYREATSALDAGDADKSEELYTKLITLVPNFATAYRRLGYLELSANNIDRAIELNRRAVELEPDGYNKSALAYALLNKETPKENKEAFDLASSAAQLLPSDEGTITVWLISAVSVDNLDAIRQADERLLQIAPANPYGHYFAGALAANDGFWVKAEKEILASRQLGLSSEAVQTALDTGISRNAMLVRLGRLVIVAFIAWLFGLAALYLVGNSLSKNTIKNLKFSQTAINAQIKPEKQRLRSVYRTLVTILSFYFYISIPFVILLLILVVAGVAYIFIRIGTIPIQLFLILAIVLLGTLFAILRTLLSRIKDTPPGHELERIEAPELWRLVEDVARKLAVRPVDKIYITPGIDIAVNEKGSILKKMRGFGQRNLILGMGVLPSMSQGQLASILAHEYGHFSNRDTAGGDLAFKVHMSLFQMTQRLIQSGAARIYNPVWLFVIGYQRIFLRVTQGASRLQEILADRYAAMAYGSQNFIDGLRNLIRQGIAFPMRANYEIQISGENKQPIINFYDLPMTDDLSVEIGKKYDAEMNRTTAEYDSHPAPQERIKWIEQLNVPYSPMHDNPQPTMQLFPNAEALQREMTEQINKSLERNE